MYNSTIADTCGLLAAGVGMTAPDGALATAAAVAAVLHCGVIVLRGVVKVARAFVAWRRGKATAKDVLDTTETALKDIEKEVSKHDLS